MRNSNGHNEKDKMLKDASLPYGNYLRETFEQMLPLSDSS